MKSKYFSFTFLLLIQFSIISSKDVFAAEIMHSLHRLSSFIVSPNNDYIVYVNRIWKKEDNKYYTNLECISVTQYQKN